MSTIELPAQDANLRRRIFAAAGLVLIADQASKVSALAILGDGERSFGPFRFLIVRNPGGPFGLADEASLIWTLATLAIVIAAIVAIGTGNLRLRPALAVGALIGGGLGNLLDRLVRYPGSGRGAVIDWIAVDPYSRVFNLADVALRGAALILVVMAFVGRPHDAPPSGKTIEAERVPHPTTTTKE